MDRNCKMCRLGCGQAVQGSGPRKPKLTVFLDHPGKKDTESGKPLMSKAGQVLRDALRNLVGLDPDTEVFFDYVLRCEPDGKQKQPEYTACKRWTTETLRDIDTDVILIAGSHAFEQLLPHVIQQEQQIDPKFNISKAHGKTYQHLGKLYFITWSPNVIEQNKVYKGVGEGRNMVAKPWFPRGSTPELFIRDMKKLRALLEARQAPASAGP